MSSVIFLYYIIIYAQECVSSLNDSGKEVPTCELQPGARMLVTKQSGLCVCVTWTNGHKQETHFTKAVYRTIVKEKPFFGFNKGLFLCETDKKVLGKG